MRRFIMTAFLILNVFVWSLSVSTIQAQPYPNRSIQLIIPGAAGGILDLGGRLLGEEVGKVLGTQLIPVNKPGGGFTVGTDFVAKSKKDGYTLAYTSSPAIVYSRILNPETVAYDPEKDLEPLGLHMFFPTALAIQASSPWKTLGELVEYAKRNPGKLRISSPGIGSVPHFNLEIVQSMTGAQLNHVPFKSGEAVITALLGGHVEMTFDAINKITPHVESGKLRILLLTMKMTEYPNVPTMTELGYKQELPSSWFAMYGPAGMPEDIKRVLISAVERGVKNPEQKAKIERMQCVVNYKSPEELKKLAGEEYEKSLALATKLGLRK